MSAELQQPDALAEYYAAVRAQQVPKPAVPDWFQKELTLIGGKNDYKWPNYRLVWGQEPAACRFRDGEWVPKYIKCFVSRQIQRQVQGSNLVWQQWFRTPIGEDRFFVEKYVPPEEIDREQWERDWRYSWDESGKKIEILGEYPSRGMYVKYIRLEDTGGGYVGPTRDAFNEIDAVIYHDRHEMGKTADQRVLEEQNLDIEIWERNNTWFRDALAHLFVTHKQHIETKTSW